MRLVTDRPTAVKDSFILMGVVEDSMKQYGCLLDAASGKIHVEEIYWTGGIRGNEATANLRSVDDDVEWTTVYNFVTQKTTILSPKKLRQAIQVARARGAKSSGIEELLKKTFPYANRKVDPNRRVTIPIPKGE